jgi:hypothetical protein
VHSSFRPGWVCSVAKAVPVRESSRSLLPAHGPTGAKTRADRGLAARWLHQCGGGRPGDACGWAAVNTSPSGHIGPPSSRYRNRRATECERVDHALHAEQRSIFCTILHKVARFGCLLVLSAPPAARSKRRWCFMTALVDHQPDGSGDPQRPSCFTRRAIAAVGRLWLVDVSR